MQSFGWSKTNDYGRINTKKYIPKLLLSYLKIILDLTFYRLIASTLKIKKNIANDSFVGKSFVEKNSLSLEVN